MRVFALSDVHTDFRENLQLLSGLSTRGYREDALILAGDVSHDLAVLRRTLELFLERFRDVFFVPGNHELWVRQGVHEHSVQKFFEVLRLCDSLGVHTGPKYVGSGADRVCVVPLFSWYTRPEEGSDSLYRERALDEPANSVWSDDYLIKWPESRGFNPTRYFLDMNESRVGAAYDATRISFSHFIPRAELMFPGPDEKKPLRLDRNLQRFNFSRVAGSTLIEGQIRKLDSKVHVYGHQHRNRRRLQDGVWYVSNCLGYREERESGHVEGPVEVVARVWPVEVGDASARGVCAPV